MLPSTLEVGEFAQRQEPNAKDCYAELRYSTRERQRDARHGRLHLLIEFPMQLS